MFIQTIGSKNVENKVEIKLDKVTQTKPVSLKTKMGPGKDFC